MTPETDRTPDDTVVAMEEPGVDTGVRRQAGLGEDPRGEAGPEGPVADEAAESQPAAGGETVKKAEFQEMSPAPVKDKATNLNLLLDVVVPVAVELGRTSLTVKDILSTCQGSVIELDRAAGEPVDVLVGGKTIAKGEVVVVGDRFGVRIASLVGTIEDVTET
jgi:flagellar motor switch protein FliN/FliY